jgi:hypothetical protein
MAEGIRRTVHVTPLYLQKLALTWPTSGIVHSWTKAMELYASTPMTEAEYSSETQAFTYNPEIQKTLSSAKEYFSGTYCLHLQGKS